MDRSIEFYLYHVDHVQNSFGQWTETITKKRVYGQTGSITRDEFFAAGQNGLMPDMMVTMFAYDYADERDCEIDDIPYSIYRTYRKRDDTIELYLERRAGDA